MVSTKNKIVLPTSRDPVVTKISKNCIARSCFHRNCIAEPVSMDCEESNVVSLFIVKGRVVNPVVSILVDPVYTVMVVSQEIQLFL